LVEQAEGNPDAAGDGGGGAVRGFGLGLVQDPGGERGVAVGDGFGGEPHGDGGQLAGVPDGGEHGHVVPLDRAVERLLQGARVGGVDVIDVDAFFSQQRRELLQQLVRRTGLELDLRRPGGWLGGAAAHVWPTVEKH